MPKDYYAVLGLAPGADDVVVHAAWKALLRKYHPDTNTDATAEARARARHQRGVRRARQARPARPL